MGVGQHAEVKATFAEALRSFEGLGATVEEVSIPTITLSGVISGAGGSGRTALQWRHLMQSPDQYDAAARRFNLLPGLLPAALYQRALRSVTVAISGHSTAADSRYQEAPCVEGAGTG